jgi:hypothetical protein
MSLAQNKDSKPKKRPVLTNKYRLQKKGEPFEGTKSAGLEKVSKGKKPKFGEFAGKTKRTNVPKNTETSKFTGKEKFIPNLPSSGFDKFTSKYDYIPAKVQLGHDKFISKYAYQPTEKKLGHDKFISKYAFTPTKKKLGHDKYTGNIIRYSYLENRKRNYARASHKQQSYSGNIVYVDLKKMRAKRDKRLQAYSGNIRTKKRPNHFKYSSIYNKKYVKKAYDSRRLRRGKFFVNKRYIPRYQKLAPTKLRYDSRGEHQIWDSEKAGGAITAGGRKKLTQKDIKRIKKEKEKTLKNPPINNKKDD